MRTFGAPVTSFLKPELYGRTSLGAGARRRRCSQPRASTGADSRHRLNIRELSSRRDMSDVAEGLGDQEVKHAQHLWVMRADDI